MNLSAVVQIDYEYPKFKKDSKSKCQDLIITNIAELIREHSSKKTCQLKVIMYSFRDPKISAKLHEAAEKGIKIRILLDKDQFNHFKTDASKERYKSTKLEFDSVTKLANHKNVEILISGSTTPPYRTIHEKTSFFHCKEDAADGILVTGSYNWSKSAAQSHYENCITVSSEPKLNREFLARFEKVWVIEKDEYKGVIYRNYPKSSPAPRRKRIATTATSSSAQPESVLRQRSPSKVRGESAAREQTPAFRSPQEKKKKE